MKMSKKILAGILAATMILGSATGVLAAGSKSSGTDVPPVPVATVTPTPAAPAPSTPAPATPAATTPAAPAKAEDTATVFTVPANALYRTAKLDDKEFAASLPAEEIKVLDDINKGDLKPADFAAQLEKANENEQDPEVKEKQQEVIDYLKADNHQIATPICALLWIAGADKTLIQLENGKYEIVLSDPAFTKEISEKNPAFLHKAAKVDEQGNKVGSYFELVKPTKYDEASKIFTMEIDQLEYALCLVADK